MRPRRSVPLVLSCAAVLLAGCGGSSLLDGSTASELEESLGRVQTAIDEGQCSQARSAARAGAERVEALPSGVDAELRDTLKRGFEELSAKVGTDCVPRTPKTTTTAVPAEPPTTVTPVQPSTSAEPTTTTEAPTTTQSTTTTSTEPEQLEPDTSEPELPEDDSGGVTPGVDGPGASERSAPNGKGPGTAKAPSRQATDARKGRNGG